jgi:hypothetical protein
MYAGYGASAKWSDLSSSMCRPLDVASDYFGFDSWSEIDDNLSLMKTWAGRASEMTWGVPMLPSTKGVSLEAGALGMYDSYFVQLSKELVANGFGASVLRLGWEFNDSGFPWYAAGKSSSFDLYWARIVDAMRSVSGARFQFEWNPALGDDGASDKAMANLANYYPGNEYVSLLGMDVYDIAYRVYPGPVKEWNSIVTRRYGLMWLDDLARGAGKSVSLPELGLGFNRSEEVGGGDNARFLELAVAWANSRHYKSVIFWDVKSSEISSRTNVRTYSAVRASF